MRPIITILALSLFSLFSLTAAFSQSKTDIGFKVGIGASGWNQGFLEEMATEYFNIDYQFGNSYAFGFYLIEQLNPRLDLSIELNFRENGNKFSYQQQAYYTQMVDNRIGQIQVPIALSWNLVNSNKSPYIKLGLSSNFIVRDQNEVTIYSEYEDDYGWAGGNYWQDLNMSKKKMSFQALGGIGWNLGKKISLEATVFWGKDSVVTPDFFCYCYYYVEQGQTIHHNRNFMLNFYYSLNKT